MSCNLDKKFTNAGNSNHANNNNPLTYIEKATWGFFGVLILFVIIQAACFGVVNTLFDSSNSARLIGLGDLFSMSYVLTTVCLIPIVLKVSKTICSKSIFQNLGLAHLPSLRQLLIFTTILAIFALIQYILGSYNIIPKPEFLEEISKSTHLLWLSFLAIVICAPLLEEMIFRSFVFDAWQNSWLRSIGTIVATSLVFTLIHLQYDIVTLMVLFVLALIFGAARFVSNSTWLSIYLHSLNNLFGWALMFFY